MQRSFVSRPCRRAVLAALACGIFAATARTQSFAAKHSDGTTHWYDAIAVPGGITWADANRAAASLGGYLVTITSSDENFTAFKISNRPDIWSQDPSTGEWNGPWIGGIQLAGHREPEEGWGWAELEPFVYSNWAASRPDNAANGNRIHFGGNKNGPAQTWVDSNAGAKRGGFVVEFSGPFAHRTVGLQQRTPASFDGYTLLNPLLSREAVLIDPRGRLVRRWSSAYPPGLSAYLLPNGNLLRAGSVSEFGFAGGRGGIVEEWDWDGNLVWQHTVASGSERQHHDIERLPNGNTLMIVWFVKSTADAIAAGRNPALLTEDALWPDKVIEVDRAGKRVWEWSVWDHLIQDFDSTKPNYGDVAKHPELVDVNYGTKVGIADWLHTNAVAYNARLDQIMISVRHFDELWVIDHSTTTVEAKGHTGGRSGRGGDLLYRWGNPAAYRAGTAQDRRLFQQHDAHWVPDALPGGGNILVFNNGVGRPGGDASSVDEIVPPATDENGNYPRTGSAWGPASAGWTYPKTPASSFFARYVSGAQRQPNGNTLICDGANGRLLEVTPAHETASDYVSPIVDAGTRASQGTVTEGRNGLFRAYRYAPDDPALRNRKLVPGDSLVSDDHVLLADGSRAPHRAKLRATVELSLISVRDAGRVYVAGTSLTPGLIPVDNRHVRVGFDVLLLPSMVGDLSPVLAGYVGLLDASGRARAAIHVPAIPELVGADLYTMFLVLEPVAPTGVLGISNTVVVRIDA